jgi:hypothetical protein
MSKERLLNTPVQVMLPRRERRDWRAAARRRRQTLSDFVRSTIREQLTADRISAADVQRDGGDEPEPPRAA